MHLLSGEDVLEQQEVAAGFSSGSMIVSASRHDRVGQLEEEVSRLRREIDWLTEQFESFKKQFD